MSSFSTFGLIFAACASSAFAMGMDGFDLPSMMANRNLLIALGVLILGIAGYMLLNCPCCSAGKTGKKMMKKKHGAVRTASVDSKRNSSSSSVRRSPRKSKLN